MSEQQIFPGVVPKSSRRPGWPQIRPKCRLSIEDRKPIRGSNAQDSSASFRPAADGDYDAVLCMYHDQGLIPLKLLDFDTGVNVTLGLPKPRTSPDHGTAYDIAGKG